MNHRQIVIANLAKGQIGEQATNLIGSCSSRTCSSWRWSAPRSPRTRACRFSPISTNFSRSARTLSRPFVGSAQVRAAFLLGNQYTSQLSPEVREAVFGNAGSMIAFRVGGRDADLLAPNCIRSSRRPWPNRRRSRRGCAATIPILSRSLPRRRCTRPEKHGGGSRRRAGATLAGLERRSRGDDREGALRFSLDSYQHLCTHDII